MNQQLKRLLFPGLRWALGLVVLWEACRELLHASHAVHTHSHAVSLVGVRLFISSSEILTCILFLYPRIRVLGGYGLLLIFVLAIGIHMAQRQWGILSFNCLCDGSIGYRGQRIVVQSSTSNVKPYQPLLVRSAVMWATWCFPCQA